MTAFRPEQLPARMAVTGAGGQLGSQLCRILGPRALPLDYPTFDLTQPASFAAQLTPLRPQVLINTAAYTAVDRAEDEAELCQTINATAVARLAEVTSNLDCLLVQISTDYVFGNLDAPARLRREEDPPHPRGVYACSKWEGEKAARTNPHHLIVRSCGLYGQPGPTASSNFVLTMLRIGRERREVRVVNDQVCCPTWVVELADAILWLISARLEETFHVVNPGPITWYDFAREIFRQADLDCAVVPITTAQYGARAPRPAFSALDTRKYATAGGPALSRWDKALTGFLQQQGGSP